MINIDQAISQFGGRRTGANAALIRCPVHEDNTPSLSIKNADNGRELVTCFAGCSPKAILNALSDSGVSDFRPSTRDTVRTVKPKAIKANKPSKPVEAGIPCTTETYFNKTRLTPQMLSTFGCVFSSVGLLHPYFDSHGTQFNKFRKHISGQPKFLWEKDTPKPAPYIFNMQCVEHYAQNDFHLNVVEGESDTLTLAAHGFAAIGISGANAVRDDLADILRLFKSVFIFKEPDKGGAKFIESILDLNIGSTTSATIIAMPPMAKDINELFKLDTTGFKYNYWRLIA